VEQHFGSTIRMLEPLHSLADFCYAVRRDVIETIGATDEVYGLGPCWEMDYNVRAARAGFRGVWACGALCPPRTFHHAACG
jgi:GT2 family glycosyltransferase